MNTVTLALVALCVLCVLCTTEATITERTRDVISQDENLDGMKRNDKMSVCYFRSWITFRHDKAQFLPENINVTLCSVVTFGFMAIDIKTFKLVGRPNNKDVFMLRDLVELKKKRQDLKIMISVG